VNFIEICLNDGVNYGENIDEVVKISIMNNLVDFGQYFHWATPAIDCKIIDGSAGKIWKLQAYTSVHTYSASYQRQKIRALRVFTDPATPSFYEEYGFLPAGGVWHTYELASNKFLVGFKVNFHYNAAGFNIPMTIDVRVTSELVVFDYFVDDPIKEVFITIGDPLDPANVFDFSYTWTPDDPFCNTNADRGSLIYSSASVGGDDPSFWSRFPAGSYNGSTKIWAPFYSLSSDRWKAGTFKWAHVLGEPVWNNPDYFDIRAIDNFLIHIIDPCTTATIIWLTSPASFTLNMNDSVQVYPFDVTDSVS